MSKLKTQINKEHGYDCATQSLSSLQGKGIETPYRHEQEAQIKGFLLSDLLIANHETIGWIDKLVGELDERLSSVLCAQIECEPSDCNQKPLPTPYPQLIDNQLCCNHYASVIAERLASIISRISI